MKFSKEDMVAITEDDYSEAYEVIEEGEWTQDNKYQHREIIFKYQGKYYSLTESRSGSPFTDWYYDSDDWDDEVEAPEVVPVQVKSTVWKVKK